MLEWPVETFYSYILLYVIQGLTILFDIYFYLVSDETIRFYFADLLMSTAGDNYSKKIV